MGINTKLIHVIIIVNFIFFSAPLWAQTSFVTLPTEEIKNNDVDLTPIHLKKDDPVYLKHLQTIKNTQGQSEAPQQVENIANTSTQERVITLPAPVETQQQQKNTSQVFVFHTNTSGNNLLRQRAQQRAQEQPQENEAGALSHQFRSSQIEALRKTAARKNK